MASMSLFAPAFAIALLCAGVMGFAIQRGATCMVAAVDQLVVDRRTNRLVALGEASLWVAACLSLAALAGWNNSLPADYPVTAWTIIGGVLLGLGAAINRACVFGAIARLGSGQVAYSATPIGFFVGCLTIQPIALAAATPARTMASGPAFWAVLAISLPVLAWRSMRLGSAARSKMLAAHVWSPHVATAVIGIAFAIMALAVGPWAYTDALAQLARGMAMDSVARSVLFLGLLGGAIAGGWTAGLIRVQRPSASRVIRCFVGGLLMGWGSILIPGGNDGLILTGLPFLLPFAFVALGAMTITIAAVSWAMRTPALEPAAGMR